MCKFLKSLFKKKESLPLDDIEVIEPEIIEQPKPIEMFIPKIELHRNWQDENQSLSTAKILNAEGQPIFTSIMLERGWKNNEVGISCIPAGTYKVVLEYSDRFKVDLWEIKGVPNRSECKFHAANYWYQLEGCIAPGRKLKHLNRDTYLDVTASGPTLADFHKALNGYTEVQLIITTDNGIF